MSWPTAFFASILTICITLMLLVALARSSKKDQRDKKETPLDDRTVTFPRLSEYTHLSSQPGGPIDPRARGGEGR